MDGAVYVSQIFTEAGHKTDHWPPTLQPRKQAEVTQAKNLAPAVRHILNGHCASVLNETMFRHTQHLVNISERSWSGVMEKKLTGT